MGIEYKIHQAIDTSVMVASGAVSISDILKVIEEARLERKGEGLSRQLIDLSKIELAFTINEGRAVILALQKMADMLGTQKIALIFGPSHSQYILDKLVTLVDYSRHDIAFFSDKHSAVQFLKEL